MLVGSLATESIGTQADTEVEGRMGKLSAKAVAEAAAPEARKAVRGEGEAMAGEDGIKEAPEATGESSGGVAEL